MAFSLEQLRDFDFQKFQDEIQNFDGDDLKRIGTASLGIRILLIAFVLLVVMLVGYFYIITPKVEQLERVQNEETTLRQTFDEKQRKASNLDAYIEQLAEMEQSFGAMLRQLPDRTDVESLIVDLSQTGARNSLNVELVRPEEEIVKDFYAELPIRLKVFGKFHELARFVSDVAALPRIVTLQDIKISFVDANSPTDLTMEMTAKTYRYIE